MATYYWVGGTGSWLASGTANAGTHWSLSSGGTAVGGTTAPTTTDSAVFDANSSASSYVVTMSNAAIGNASFSPPATGTLSFVKTIAITVNGNLYIAPSNIVFSTYTSAAWTIGSATALSCFLDTNNYVFPAATTFAIGTGGVAVVLLSNLSSVVTVTGSVSSSFDLNGKTFFGFYTNSGATGSVFKINGGTINSINCVSTSTFDATNGGTISPLQGACFFSFAAVVSFVGDTTKINVYAPNSAATLFAWSIVNASVVIGSYYVSGCPIAINGNCSCSSFYYDDNNGTGTTGSGLDFSLNGINAVLNSLSTITIIAEGENTGIYNSRIYIHGNAGVSSPNFKAAGKITLIGVTLFQVNASYASISLTRCADTGKNTNIPFVSSNVYWVGGSGSWDDNAHWALSSGGTPIAGLTPLPPQKAIFDANSFASASTVSIGTSSVYYNALPTINASSITKQCAINVAGNACLSFGSFFGCANLTVQGTGTPSITFGNQYIPITINSNGTSFLVQAICTNVSLASDFYVGPITGNASPFLGSSCTVILNNFIFTIDGTATTIVATSAFNIDSGTGYFRIKTNLTTFNGAYSFFTAKKVLFLVDLAPNQTTTFTSSFSGYPYDLIFNSGDNLVLNLGQMPFNTNSGKITVNATVKNATVIFPTAGGTFNSQIRIFGSAANLQTVKSQTNGTKATTIFAVYTCYLSYCNVQDIGATGRSVIANNCNNVSNNSGITFTSNQNNFGKMFY